MIRRLSTGINVLLLTTLLLACRTAQQSAGGPERIAAEATEDPGVLVIRAWQAHGEGDVDRAMALLNRADALGLDIPQDGRDFPKLAARPEWNALVERIAAREAKTPRATVAITLPERGLLAEGIAAHPDGRTVYVSSIRGRKILRITEDGQAELVPSAAGGLLSPLGMKVDPASGLLWVAANASPAMDGWDPSLRGRSGLYAFDTRSGGLRRSVALTAAGDHLLNDVAIASDGTVFVTDSTAGAVHRLDPGATELRPAVPGGFVYPNGIVVAGEHVLFAHALGLHAFPIAGGDPFPVRGPPGFPLGGVDGLAIDGRTLLGVQNALGKPRIVRLELAPAEVRIARAAVVETANPLWRVPTTGAFARGGFLYIANSHVDAIGDAGVAPEARVETVILKLPVR